jgi:riboflavin transporter FmnP
VIKSTRRLVFLGLLSSLAFLLIYFLETPLPFFAPYLKYDASEVPVLLAAFGFGPAAGVMVEVVKTALFFLSGKDPTAPVGPSAMFVAGVTLTVVSGLVYARLRTKHRAVIALLLGTLAMTAVMLLVNSYVFMPLYGIPRGQAAVSASFAVAPFNLVKGLITSVLTLALFPRLKSFVD